MEINKQRDYSYWRKIMPRSAQMSMDQMMEVSTQRDFDLMMERTSEKQLDKMVADIKKHHAKQALVVRRDNAFMKRAYGLGKALGKLADDPFLTSWLAFNVGAFSGRKRKNLKKFFEGHYGPERMKEVEILLVETSQGYYELPPLMEGEAEDFLQLEPILESSLEWAERLERPRLTVATLVEEVRAIQKKKKVAPTPKKPDQLHLFVSLYNKFKIKLAELGISDPAKVEAMMLRMVSLVNQINLRKREEAEAAKPIVKEELTPSVTGMSLGQILALAD
jgi:hypothetical protein